MTRSQYYAELKALARQVRAEHGLTGPRVKLADLRRIYRAYGVKIDYWPVRMKKLRGAYFNDELGVRVMIDKNLPEEQRIFTLAHELKHHLTDKTGHHRSTDIPNDPIEIGAEIFAAELIYPESEFAEWFHTHGIGTGACTPETIVKLKRETGTTLSFTALAKRAEFLGFATTGSLKGVTWKKLEESLYGEPVYKRIQRLRAVRNR